MFLSGRQCVGSLKHRGVNSFKMNVVKSFIYEVEETDSELIIHEAGTIFAIQHYKNVFLLVIGTNLQNVS